MDIIKSYKDKNAANYTWINFPLTPAVHTCIVSSYNHVHVSEHFCGSFASTWSAKCQWIKAHVQK